MFIKLHETNTNLPIVLKSSLVIKAFKKNSETNINIVSNGKMLVVEVNESVEKIIKMLNGSQKNFLLLHDNDNNNPMAVNKEYIEYVCVENHETYIQCSYVNYGFGVVESADKLHQMLTKKDSPSSVKAEGETPSDKQVSDVAN